MKKRLFSLVLTLALCLGLTVPVSAKLSDNYEIFSVICDDYVISTTEGSGGSVLSAHDGLRDKAGNIVLPAEYIDLQFIDGADALIARKHMEGRRYADGIIDVHGNTLVPFQYINIDPLSGHKGYLTVEDPSTYLRGLLGPDFSLVVPTKYYTVDVLSEEDGYYAVADPGKAGTASDSLWNMFRKGEKWGVLDRNGREIFPCVYDSIRYLKDGYFAVQQGADTGVMNSQGQMVLPMEYAGISRHRDTFIATKYKSEEYRQRVAAGEGMPSLGESWTTAGVVDIHGKPLIDFGTYAVISFSEGNSVFSCGKWEGQYKASDVQIVGAPTHYENTYTYDYFFYSTVYNSEVNAISPDGPSIIITVPGGIIAVRVPGSGTKPSEQTPIISNSSNAFTDVKSTDYYSDAVQWAVEKNITSGTSKTTFSPDATCSKAQILTFLWHANGSPEPTAATPFTDVKTADYFYKAALWAAEKGLVSGSTFGANADCTRAMTVEYMWKAAGSPAPAGKADFDDVPANADYAQAVAWAVEKNITSGTGDGNFSPTATCTRGQIVTFLYRAMGK